MESGPISLRGRDRAIIEHVARYRITVREVVQKLFFPDSDVNAATKVLGRLTHAEILRRHQLTGPRVYWTLSPELAELRGERAKRGRALGYNDLVRHYGVLSFCHEGRIQREIMTHREFKERFPDHYDPTLLGTPYYVEEVEGQRLLGLVLVSDQEDIVRLVRKCRGLIARRLENPGFRKTIHAGRLAIAVVTAFPEKKARLEDALAEADLRSVHFRVTVRSGLAQVQVSNATKRIKQPKTA